MNFCVDHDLESIWNPDRDVTDWDLLISLSISIFTLNIFLTLLFIIHVAISGGRYVSPKSEIA